MVLGFIQALWALLEVEMISNLFANDRQTGPGYLCLSDR